MAALIVEQRIGIAVRCIVVGGLIFVADLLIPPGVAVGILYVTVILLARRMERNRDVVVAAVAGTALTLAGYLLNPPDTPSWMAVANRAGSVAVIWLAASCAIRESKLTLQKSAEESERRCRVLVDRAPICIYEIDLSGRILSINSAGRVLMGMDGEDRIVARDFLDFLPATDRQRVWQHFQEAAGGVETVFEFRTVGRNGTRFLWAKFVPVLTHEGSVEKILGYVLDITTAKSELRLQTIISEMPVMIDAICDDMSIGFWNRECERVTGYSAEEIVGRPDALKLLYPDRNVHEWIYHACEVRTAESDFRDRELELTCKDGSRRIISWSSVSGRAPIPGWHTWAVGIDVTDRVRSEQALRRSEALLNEAQQIAHVGSWDWNIATGALDWSAEVYRIFGRDPQTFQATYPHFLECVHPEDRQAVEVAVNDALRENRTYSVDHRIIRPDGEVRTVHEEAKVFASGGQPVRMVGTVQDITERRKLEEQARNRQEEIAHASRLATLGELASGLAHELNQPLTAIGTYADICAKVFADLKLSPATAARLSDLLEKIKTQSLRAGQIVHRLRRLAARKSPKRGTVRLEELVENVVSLLTPLLGQHGVELRVELSSDVPELQVDSIQIEQVLLNLMRNAIEAMTQVPRDARILSVRALPVDEESIEIAVSDTGPGISPAMRDVLFEPFATDKEEGMGLGLAISRSIVEEHGGTLTVTPRDETGVTFHVVLPIDGRRR